MSRTPNFPKRLRRLRLTLSKAARRDSARLGDGCARELAGALARDAKDVGDGTPAEVAATVYRLCNRDFGYVTGTEVFVTGGQHLY